MEATLYGRLLRIVALFSPRALQWLQLRKGWQQRLAEARPEDKAVIWAHFEDAQDHERYQRILKALEAHYPNEAVIISYEKAPPEGQAVPEGVHYLPLLTQSNIEDWLDIVAPEMVLMGYPELPTRMLWNLQQRQVPTYILGAQFGPRDPWLMPGRRSLLKTQLGYCSHVYGLDEETLERITVHLGLPADSVTLAGDPHVDVWAAQADTALPNAKIATFVENRITMVVDRPESDELKMISALSANPVYDRVRWLIIPKDKFDAKIDARVDRAPDTELLHTENTAILASHRILWVDEEEVDDATVYKYGTLAIVGGGFTRQGIPPLWNAATAGLPAFFGPRYKRRRTATDLLALGVGHTFFSRRGLDKKLRPYLRDGVPADQAMAIRGYVVEKSGASDRTAKDIMRRHPELVNHLATLADSEV